MHITLPRTWSHQIMAPTQLQNALCTKNLAGRTEHRWSHSFIHSFKKVGPGNPPFPFLQQHVLSLAHWTHSPSLLQKYFLFLFILFLLHYQLKNKADTPKLNSLKRSKHQRKTTSKFPSQIFLLNPHGCKLFFDLWKTNKKKILFSPTFIAFGRLLFCFLLELVGLCSSLCVFNKLVYFQLNGFNSTPHMIIWRLMSSDVIGCCLFLPCNYLFQFGACWLSVLIFVAFSFGIWMQILEVLPIGYFKKSFYAVLGN